MELSELLEFQRDPCLCTSPIISKHGGKQEAAIFRSIPVGVMKTSVNEVKEDTGFREAFAHEQSHFGWMMSLGSFRLLLLVRLWGLLGLKAFLQDRKKQKEIDLSSLSPGPRYFLNDIERTAVDFALEAFSIFKRVHINPPPWDRSGVLYQTSLNEAPDPFYRESYQVLKNMMNRMKKACGLRKRRDALWLIASVLTPSPVLAPLSINSQTQRQYARFPQVVDFLDPRNWFELPVKEHKFFSWLREGLLLAAKKPFSHLLMKLDDNPKKIGSLYANTYGDNIKKIKAIEQKMAFYLKRKLHQRKKGEDNPYLLSVSLWFVEALSRPDYQIDNTFDVHRSIDMSNFKDSSLSNRQGMLFLLANEIIRSFQNPYQEIGELFDPNSGERFSWLDVLFSDWIRNWAEKGGLLTCPLVHAQEEVTCFDHGCPLCQEKVIPSESNAYCIQEGGVSLSKVRDRKCLFWDVFSAIFDGYEKVTHES